MATTKIRSSSITDGQVDNADLSPTVAVTGGQIADDAVTLAKMAGLARGKIIVGDASGDPSALAVGASTQVLTSDGTDATWTAPATTAVDFVKVITLTASDDTELEFTSTHVTSDYKQLIFMFYDMVSADDYAELRVAFSDDNGVSYDSSWYGTFFYPWTTNIDSHQSVYVPGSSYGLADATLAFNNSYDSDHGMGGEFRVQNHAGTTNVKTWQCYLSYPTYHSPVAVYNPLPGGFFDSTAAINNIKFYMGTGNITSGSIAMWGMK